jgi:hypothetical protein
MSKISFLPKDIQQMFPTCTNIIAGLVQTDGTNILHDPVTGWPVIMPELSPNKLTTILLQDDLTYHGGRVVELDKYIDEYGAENIENVVFLTWHIRLVQGAPLIEDRFGNHVHGYDFLKLVYYPTFHYEHWISAHKENIKDSFTFNDDKQFNFLCLNMNERPHRSKTIELVQDFDNRLLSYKAVGWELPDFDDWTTEEYNSTPSTESGVLRNTANLLKLKPIYDKCQFSIVCETRYTLPYDFVTEKTTQTWLALHPALYVSNSGHVQLLRDWGFDVFDDIFDHSYDDIITPYTSSLDFTRIETMINDNRDVFENGISGYANLGPRLIKNRQHYLDNFIDIQANIHFQQRQKQKLDMQWSPPTS